MPILPDDDAMYFVVGGPQIDPSIYRTKLGSATAKEKQPEGAENAEQSNQPDKKE